MFVLCNAHLDGTCKILHRYSVTAASRVLNTTRSYLHLSCIVHLIAVFIYLFLF
jgi:hypothetical protein